ncbi:MAG: NAD(P)H-binding protein [Gammaproteobacteria bacterium]|jgi:nucleoside-diphosphate-sugar epimerase|nr:NAD(P)H-binding protein [Gammaproteobacteria bacterium]
MVPADPAPSTLVIFGAESDTGYRLLQLARKADRRVLGVVGHPRETGLIERMGAEAVVADPAKRDEVDRVFAGRDATGLEVVCFIGGTPQLNSQGNINVIDAANAAGVRRFILTTSIGCGDSAVVLDPFVKAFAGKSIRAKDWAEKQLRATGMAWTIVRSGGMHGRPSRGTAVLVESPWVVGYINRTDLGDLVWQVVSSPKSAGRVFAAVDGSKAMNIKGEPLVPAEL